MSYKLPYIQTWKFALIKSTNFSSVFWFLLHNTDPNWYIYFSDRMRWYIQQIIFIIYYSYFDTNATTNVMYPVCVTNVTSYMELQIFFIAKTQCRPRYHKSAPKYRFPPFCKPFFVTSIIILSTKILHLYSTTPLPQGVESSLFSLMDLISSPFVGGDRDIKSSEDSI